MSHLQKATAAWGNALPDWVKALAGKCDETSQARAANLVGYSSTTLSLVIGNRYAGDMAAVEERVRATVMSQSIRCPELGDLDLAQCLDWRKRATDFQPTSTLRRMMFDACRACPHNPASSGRPSPAGPAAQPAAKKGGA